ncbi:hypothetical protein EVJ58_g9290, partial [Rhodofomes roseus]
DALDSDSGDEDDYEPDARATTQRRRGRKPGALSRSARESLRKLNHSRIEKARRTKINETLATLSALVSEADQEQAKDAGEKPGETKTKGRTEEKEFKLDVLVKTVVYVQGLIDKVRTLEAAADACLHCSRDRVAGSTPDLKRKRPAEQHAKRDVDMTVNVDEEDEEDVEYAGDDEKGDGEPERDSPTGTLPDHSPALTATAAAASTSTRATISPRLPPIAAWLPHPYVDPSCIAAMSDSRAAATSQLPSPPLSGPFRAASSVAARDVPALALPGAPRTLSSQSKGERTHLTSAARARTRARRHEQLAGVDAGELRPDELCVERRYVGVCAPEGNGGAGAQDVDDPGWGAGSGQGRERKAEREDERPGGDAEFTVGLGTVSG